MPNHITNRITVEPAGLFEQVHDALVDAEGNVDFGKVLPHPDGFIDHDSIMGGADDRAANLLGLPMPDKDDLMGRLQCHGRVRVVTSEARPDEVQQAVEMASNYLLCGFFNWYDWRIEHWGTKWNAYKTEITDDEIAFETAWSAPRPVFKALAKRFPGATITVCYADEDIGHNCGTLTYADGALVGDDSRVRDREYSDAENRSFKLFALKVRYPEGKPEDHYHHADGRPFTEDDEEAAYSAERSAGTSA